MRSIDARTYDVINDELSAVNQRISWIRKDLRSMRAIRGVDGNLPLDIARLSEKYRANLRRELEHRRALLAQLQLVLV